MTRTSPLVVGLTGGIGSGKSTVARALAERGARVLDADEIVSEVYRDLGILERIEREVGPGVVGPGGVDRHSLARKIFGELGARERLNAIVHPEVRRRMRERTEIWKAGPDPPSLIVWDVPLLIESGGYREVDRVVVVWASRPTRIRRVVERMGASADDVQARDEAQMPLHQKLAYAHHVVNNDSDESALLGEVERLLAELALPALAPGGAWKPTEP